MTDWNAAEYHRLSEPQLAWGRDVLARVTLRGDELAADVGCGTGRLTAEVADRLPEGHVLAVDASEAMVREAKAFLQRSVEVIRADACALPFERALDLVFSTATFHWVHDHDRLFSSIFRALKPGGRLVAQCGGGPNLDRLYRRAEALMRRPDYTAYFMDWRAPWYFADARTTRRRLETAGFVEVVTALYSSPVSFETPERYRDFLTTVCVRHHLARLPLELRAAFTAQLAEDAARDEPPLTLDYWRLDLTATAGH
jgi:trans-aconitate 2-methyltransferase